MSEREGRGTPGPAGRQVAISLGTPAPDARRGSAASAERPRPSMPTARQLVRWGRGLARSLPVVLLLVAAALAALAAIHLAGPAANVWWTLLPVDPADPDAAVLLVTAAAIVALAIGLARRKRGAFLFALASFGAAVVAQGWLLSHPRGGLVAAACLAILVADRRRYVVRAPQADRLLLLLAAAAMSTAVLGVLIGVADRHLDMGPAQDALIAVQGAAAIVSFSSAHSMAPAVDGALLVALIVLARLAIAIGAIGVLRPEAPLPRPLSARARGIVESHGRGALVPFQLGPQVSAFEPPGLDAVVVHAIEGRWAVALGDPVGTDADVAPAWGRFTGWCAGHDLIPAIYQASPERLETVARGRRAFRIGLEAIVDLATFDLSGSRRANLRHTVTRARRGGVSVEWSPHGLPASSPGLRDELVAVDAAWSTARGGPAMGFTVGRFDAEELGRVALSVAREADGRVVAFATFRPTGGAGWVLELMRRLPGSVPGAFEACLAEAAAALRADGATELSLGLAPLAGLSTHRGPLEERVLAAAARLARPMYDVAGLEFFKRKLDPRWEPRYVVVRRRADVVGLALALVRLHLGRPGLRGAATSVILDGWSAIAGRHAVPPG